MRCQGSVGRWSDGGAVVVLALAIRAAVLLLTPDALEADPDGYRAVGENLLRHGVLGHGPYPTAVRPPLYPLVLAVCEAFGSSARWVLGLVHLTLGTVTVWLAWDLARICHMRRWQQWLVAGLVTCDPLLVRASTLVMTETLAALLATAALNLWSRYLRQPSPWRAGLLGAILGLGSLCRAEWLLWVLAGAGMLRIRLPGGTLQRRHSAWKMVGFYLGAAGLVLAPWAIRNARQFGWPVLTTTHGGYTMLLANNPWLYNHLRQEGALADWNPEPFHQAWHQVVEERFLLNRPPSASGNSPEQEPSGKTNPPARGDCPVPIVDELAADRWAYQEAIQTIRENPGIFCRAVLLRWGRLWQLVPSRVGNRPLDWLVYYGCLAWYGGVFTLAIWGIWVIYAKKKGNPHLRNTLLLALVWAGLLTAVHTFYWTEMRMRSPLTVGLVLVGVYGLARIFSQRKGASFPTAPGTVGGL